MITVGAPGLRCRLIQAYHTIDGRLRLQISKDEEELIKKRLEVCNPLHCTVSVAHPTPDCQGHAIGWTGLCLPVGCASCAKS